MNPATHSPIARPRRRRLHDERGMSMVFIAVGFFSFFAATTLAIDVGLFMTARSQAQNAADAGALAGAVAFAYNSFDDRSSSGPVVQSAINTATANKVIGGSVSVEPGDVTFPIGSNGTFNRVKVTVYRTALRENSIPTLIGPVFGVDDFDIVASATAEAAPATGVKCVKPFIIPDRWQEKQDAVWSDTSTFNRYDNKGKVIANPDVYVMPGQTGYKGYTVNDRGTYLQLRASNSNKIAPTMYYSWKMPDDIGANYYEENISGCNPRVISPGVAAIQEPGAMTGPTLAGIAALMAKDPTARWDDRTKTVVSPYGSSSPRLFPIPLYNPDTYQNGTQTGRNATLNVVNFMAFFLESYDNNGIYGRVAGLTGVIDPNAPAAMPDNSLIKAIRLVQ